MLIAPKTFTEALAHFEAITSRKLSDAEKKALFLVVKDYCSAAFFQKINNGPPEAGDTVIELFNQLFNREGT